MWQAQLDRAAHRFFQRHLRSSCCFSCSISSLFLLVLLLIFLGGVGRVGGTDRVARPLFSTVPLPVRDALLVQSACMRGSTNYKCRVPVCLPNLSQAPNRPAIGGLGPRALQCSRSPSYEHVWRFAACPCVATVVHFLARVLSFTLPLNCLALWWQPHCVKFLWPLAVPPRALRALGLGVETAPGYPPPPPPLPPPLSSFGILSLLVLQA